jgi:hypothetical protein
MDDPDPSAIDALLGLLTDGRESPLYNPAVHASELYATLIDVSRRLLRSEGNCLGVLNRELASAGRAGQQQTEEAVEHLQVE